MPELLNLARMRCLIGRCLTQGLDLDSDRADLRAQFVGNLIWALRLLRSGTTLGIGSLPPRPRILS